MVEFVAKSIVLHPWDNKIYDLVSNNSRPFFSNKKRDQKSTHTHKEYNLNAFYEQQINGS